VGVRGRYSSQVEEVIDREPRLRCLTTKIDKKGTGAVGESSFAKKEKHMSASPKRGESRRIGDGIKDSSGGKKINQVE